MRKRQRFVVIDDHPLVRYSLKAFIEQGGHRLVGEGSSVAEGSRILKEAEWDFLLLDLTFRDGDGIEMIREWHGKKPRSKIMVVSMSCLASTILKCIKAGADGFFCKEDQLDQLPAAFEEVLSGGSFISSRAMDSILTDRYKELPPMKVRQCILSPREKFVIELIGEGYTRREISKWHGIGLSTLETFLKRATRKLGLKSRGDLVRYALILKGGPPQALVILPAEASPEGLSEDKLVSGSPAGRKMDAIPQLRRNSFR